MTAVRGADATHRPPACSTRLAVATVTSPGVWLYNWKYRLKQSDFPTLTDRSAWVAYREGLELLRREWHDGPSLREAIANGEKVSSASYGPSENSEWFVGPSAGSVPLPPLSYGRAFGRTPGATAYNWTAWRLGGRIWLVLTKSGPETTDFQVILPTAAGPPGLEVDSAGTQGVGGLVQANWDPATQTLTVQFDESEIDGAVLRIAE